MQDEENKADEITSHHLSSQNYVPFLVIWSHHTSSPLSLQVKVLKKPRFDLANLLELHGDGGGKGAEVSTGAAEGGVTIDRPEGYEPPVQESV